MPKNRGFGLWPFFILTRLLVCLAAIALSAEVPALCQNAKQSTGPGNTSNVSAQSAAARPKKLILKDGTYQLARDYQVEGDRVRYYSLDSGQWEQMPADLVDWDATKKAEAEEEKRQAALLGGVHKREAESQAEVMDVDASIEVAPKIFLPPGDGIFVFDGHSVQKLAEAEESSSLSKGKLVEKVLMPIPITPTRHNISIKGEHAAVRIHSGGPEFYLRVKGVRPELQLFHAKVHAGNREVEHLDDLLGEQSLSGKTINMEVWEVAPGVYRFVPTQEMPPGEYALAQVTSSDPVSILLWDLGVAVKAEAQASPLH